MISENIRHMQSRRGIKEEKIRTAHIHTEFLFLEQSRCDAVSEYGRKENEYETFIKIFIFVSAVFGFLVASGSVRNGCEQISGKCKEPDSEKAKRYVRQADLDESIQCHGVSSLYY